MKINTNRSFSKINKFIENIKYEKHQKELNKFVNIEDVEQSDAYKQLYDARDMLANYAKANNVHFKFKTVPPDSHLKGEYMSVFVSNDKNIQVGLINSDTNDLVTVQRVRERMLKNKDGKNYIAKGIDTHEDNFLCRVYRTVENLTKTVSK